ERLERHGHERDRHLLAGREQHGELTRVGVGRDGKGKVEQLIGAISHRGDDDHHLITRTYALNNAPGDMADAVRVRDGGAAVLLDNQHGFEGTGAEELGTGTRAGVLARDACQRLPGLEHRPNEGLVFEFGVDPQQRLGAGKPEKQEAALDEKSPTIGAVRAEHWLSGDDGWARRVKDCLDTCVRAWLQFEIQPLVKMRAGNREHFFEQLGRRFAGERDVIEQKQPGQDAVAFRQVAPKAVAATLFATYECVFAHHDRPNVLEAHRSLDARHAVVLREKLDHVCGRHGFDDRTPKLARAQQIVRQQGVGTELVDIAALFVHEPHAVGIAIVRNAGDVFAAVHQQHEFVEVRLNRLGRADAGEVGVSLRVDLFDGGASSGQKRGEELSARAIHRVYSDFEPGGTNAPDVDLAAQRFEVSLDRVEALDQF